MINKIRAFVANVKAALEYRAAVNQTIKELSRLTNHELMILVFHVVRFIQSQITHIHYQRKNQQMIF